MRRELSCCALSRSFARRGLSCGGRQEGSGNLEPGPCFPGAGGGSGFPSAFPDWSSLLPVHSQSRAVVFLTSPSCLVEGVRSGTRRRRGPCPSPQAGGGTGPGMRRAAPVHESAVLYGRCTVAVWPECGFV